MHHNDQSDYHSTELQAQVGKVTAFLRIGILIPLVVGLVFLVFGLYILLDALGSGRLGYAVIAVPALGLAVFSFGLFELKLASDFEKLRPWTYRWVEFLTNSNWKWGTGCQQLYSPKVRKAFHQPEFEHPCA